MRRVALGAIVGSALMSMAGAQDTKALIESGTQKYHAKDFDGAIADYAKAIEADPKSAIAYSCRGMAKSFKDDWKGCLADLNTALSIAPESIEFLSNRAFAQLNLGNLSAALEDFATMKRLDAEKGAKIKLQIGHGLVWRARSKSAKGDKAGAIQDLDMVIALFPEDGMAYHERGGAKSDLKQYKEAIADLDQAIKLDGGYNQFGDSFALRAKAKRALGDDAGADADDREASKRFPK